MLHLDPLPYFAPADSTSRLALTVRTDRFEDGKFGWSANRLLITAQLPAGSKAAFFVRLPWVSLDNGGLSLFSRWPWLRNYDDEGQLVDWPEVQRRSSFGQPEVGLTGPVLLSGLGQWDIGAALGLPAGSDFLYPFSSASIPLRLQLRRRFDLGQRLHAASTFGYLKSMGSGKEWLDGDEAFTDGHLVSLQGGMNLGFRSRVLLGYTLQERSGRRSQEVGLEVWFPWADTGSVGLDFQRELQGSLDRAAAWRLGGDVPFRQPSLSGGGRTHPGLSGSFFPRRCVLPWPGTAGVVFSHDGGPRRHFPDPFPPFPVIPRPSLQGGVGLIKSLIFNKLSVGMGFADRGEPGGSGFRAAGKDAGVTHVLLDRNLAAASRLKRQFHRWGMTSGWFDPREDGSCWPGILDCDLVLVAADAAGRPAPHPFDPMAPLILLGVSGPVLLSRNAWQGLPQGEPGDGTLRAAIQRSLEQSAILRQEAGAEGEKEEFLAYLSHEMRSPLTAAKTSLEILSAELAELDHGDDRSEERQRLVQILERNLGRLQRSVEWSQELLVSSLGADNLFLEDLEVSELEVMLEQHFATQVDPAAREFTTHTDPVALVQLLRQLGRALAAIHPRAEQVLRVASHGEGSRGLVLTLAAGDQNEAAPDTRRTGLVSALHPSGSRRLDLKALVGHVSSAPLAARLGVELEVAEDGVHVALTPTDETREAPLRNLA